MNRFFVNKDNIKEGRVIIEGEDVKHIRNVLRLNEGDLITVCDCQKNDYLVEITDIKKNYVQCNILEKSKSKGEPNLEVVLYQGIPKSSKMDLIIQKATELGISQIVPVEMKRSVVKLKNEKKEQKKLNRWRRIAKEAAKQCRRGIIPAVSEIVSFNEMLKSLEKEEFILVPYENEDKVGLKDILAKNKGKHKVNIIIGPEGGFEEEEIDNINKLNWHVVSLGPRILRTETAGFTVLSIVMYELGDLGVI
ncbi:16S rRNA (uracil(1498)-N(3))-methyltransferase [Thermohalobacter berrensis]|uniref:Ribosomal RNA small subunit methyltransferase E n=1 Tax=Thermohalobacter berrensis TaxID=99594 RepID=A0A419TBA5_9FIRM|nr:16S rRNA (uracil(1498)-N(3))-methyltransferase [Thermohalobacter berrensis]RKD34743.1 16S rRNA methyltransferase [Thermohalobacter berrensis]